MNFGTLKSRILAIIGRAPADICYELVTADINQRLRLSCMEASATLTESATVSLPADFLQVKSVYRDVDPRTVLAPLTDQAMHRIHETSGTPAYYSIIDDAGTKKLQLTPSPDGSENIVLRYYAKLSDLSADSDENDILTVYPSVYVYGVLAHHSALIRDMNAAAGYLTAFQNAVGQAKADDRKNQMGGAPIHPVVGTAP